jgi:hypothetical protein
VLNRQERSTGVRACLRRRAGWPSRKSNYRHDPNMMERCSSPADYRASNGSEGMELAGLEPATSWVRLAPRLFGTVSPGLFRSRQFCQVRLDSLSSVSRLVARTSSWPATAGGRAQRPTTYGEAFHAFQRACQVGSGRGVAGRAPWRPPVSHASRREAHFGTTRGTPRGRGRGLTLSAAAALRLPAASMR